ncbi:MAG TPA: GspE/PulE family protein [Opitutaceae bacterium]|nr:GspE/PulE family protein [Opitutaceae bacterium]
MTPADRFLLSLAVRSGLLGDSDREKATLLAQAASPTAETKDVSRWLLEEAGVEEQSLAQVMANHFGLTLALDPLVGRDLVQARGLVPEHLARRLRIVPLEQTRGGLSIAIDNPVDESRLADVVQATGSQVHPVISTRSAIERALGVLYAPTPESSSERPSFALKTEETVSPATQRRPAIGERRDGIPREEDVGSARRVEALIAGAVRRGASDIHLEPTEQWLAVRYRIDGELVHADPVPAEKQGAVISRLKILAGLSISERRLPQDGRMRQEVDGRSTDIRVSSLPSVWGESLVLRLLDPASMIKRPEDLGFSVQQRERWTRVVSGQDGLVLVTGPTGSGKTTTLYSTLHRLNAVTRKIITVEDPVEFEVPGINQVAVRPELNVTFSSVLRSMLRQSPDVIMVGEVRDRETAEMVIQASLTGHLVFSTLHTNDAVGAVSRMINLGVKPFLVASALRAVLAQRLVRKVCPSCRGNRPPSAPPGGTPDAVSRNTPKGYSKSSLTCSQCGGSGYHGRIGLFELLVPDHTLRESIAQGCSLGDLRARVRAEGFPTLREDGLSKAARGETTLEEVLGATINDNN